MGFATHLGPWLLGTVKNTTGTTVGTIRNTGTTVVSQTNTLTFANTTAKNLFVIPAGSQILEVIIDIVTPFNSSGTDLIDVGTTADNAYYVNDATASAAGHFVATLVSTSIAGILNVGTVDKQITGKYVQSVADATAGLAQITVVYAVKNADGGSYPTGNQN